MAFSLGVVLAVRLLEAIAVNASRSYGASDGPRSERTFALRSDRAIAYISRQCVNEPMG